MPRDKISCTFSTAVGCDQEAMCDHLFFVHSLWSLAVSGSASGGLKPYQLEKIGIEPEDMQTISETLMGLYEKF